jgi:hypothetical protein
MRLSTLAVGLPASGLGCGYSATRVGLELSSESMFHLQAVYVVTNLGRAACTLRGFPLLTPYHQSHGSAKAINRVGVQVADVGRVRTIWLRSGQRAGFIVRFTDDPSRTTPCPSTEFVVLLPGQTHSRLLGPESTFNVCPPASYADPLTISPVEGFRKIPRPARKY